MIKVKRQKKSRKARCRKEKLGQNRMKKHVTQNV